MSTDYKRIGVNVVEQTNEDKMHLRNRGGTFKRISKWEILDDKLSLHSALFTEQQKQSILDSLDEYQ